MYLVLRTAIHTGPVSAMVSPSTSSLFSTASSSATPYNNVLLSSAYLMPIRGRLITAHQTRQKVLNLLEETQIRRRDNSNDEKQGRAMIVDITATVWNWDTYAIVAGKPSPVKLFFPNKEELMKYLSLDDKEIVQKGILVPQPHNNELVWVPKGAILNEVNTPQQVVDNDNDNNNKIVMEEFVFEAPVDPNDDRLEHWEQDVVGNTQQLSTARSEIAIDSMRAMLRFYNLDRIICWDLSWGMWEAVRDNNHNDTSTCDVDCDGFPKMMLVKDGKNDLPFPFSLDDDETKKKLLQDYCQPISPRLLAETVTSVSGYYLVGGNTYTMSLFHHMWDQQKYQQTEDGDDDDKDDAKIGHMQLLRNKVQDGTLFYMGHSAGLIMAGPNILTATFKGIDAFSVVTQPYNAPFVRLPPSETSTSFFVSETEKNNLYTARMKMLDKMKAYGAWRGYNIVKALAFPHYDARPRVSSFPQSAETYLRATNEDGQFEQLEGSLLIGKLKGERIEPDEVTKLRQDTNFKHLPCYPVANGHAFVMRCGGLEVVETLSPEEEGEGILHFDTYMPYVPDKEYRQFVPGRTQFTVGSFTNDADTIAGDRSSAESDDGDYNGSRIFSRLEALGLPNPNKNTEGKAGRLFRSE